MVKIDITIDQHERLLTVLTEGVSDEDSDETEKLLKELGVTQEVAEELSAQVLQVGKLVSEVGGCFCFGCPFDLTQAIKILQKQLKKVFTIEKEKFYL